VDTEGQVDRFYRKLEAREGYIQGAKDREAAKVSPDTPIAELDIGKRAQTALEKAGITDAGQALALMAQGDMALLEIDNFGRKSLADLKRRMKARGFELPEFSEEPQA
jgi:large subunit ribosomal protein L31